MNKKILVFVLMLALLIPAVMPTGITAAAPSVTLPSLTADSKCASYDSSDESKVYYYTGVSQANYESYITTLVSEGYSTLKVYSADSCNYALLDNGTATVYVSFLRSVSGTSKGRLRVFVQASGTEYYTQSTATSANICTPMLWQLDVDNTGGANGGMSYVIRLTDGTFAVIDGGYNTEAEAKNLYSILTENNPLAGKPVISAWFITHMHIDHYGALLKFAGLYSNKVSVKGFFYNFPSQTVDDVTAKTIATVEKAMKYWSDTKLYSKIHSGMVLGFAGATVEILCTHEDVNQSYYEKNSSWLSTSYDLTSNNFNDDGNNTSTVMRFNIAGQKIMFLADAEGGSGGGESKTLTGTYTGSYLKSDIMQMSHHGFTDGVKAALIESIDPDVILWPMDIICYSNGEISANGDYSTFGYHYELTGDDDISAAKSCASEIIPAYKNQALSLPYTANTIQSGKVPDYETLITEKTKVLNAADDIYIQWNDDKSKVRLVGVLNISDSELAEYSSFGYKITMVYHGNTYTNLYTTTEVLKSVNADGVTVTAGSLGGTYLYAIQITGLEAIDSTVEFVITGTGVHNSSSNYTVDYAIGKFAAAPMLSAQENGSIISYEFSDIISGSWN